MDERDESGSTEQKYDTQETQYIGQEMMQMVDAKEDHVSVTVNSGISTNGQEDKKDTEKDGMVDWKLPLGEFMSKKRGEGKNGELISKNLKSFYKSQDMLIDAYMELQDCNHVDDDQERVTHLRKQASIYSKLTFFANVFLLIIKLVAVILSGSISLICSLVDSSVDLASGLIIWLASRAVKRRNPYSYPQGRTKLEPIVIVILAVMMAITALELIKESITKIIGFANKTDTPPNMDFITIGISIATVVIKLTLHLLCRRIPHPTIQALAKDHFNDVLSNSVAILFGYIGSAEMQGKVKAYELLYVDPAGAILISLYIVVNWWKTGKSQVRMLTGYRAEPEFLSRLTWMCLNHHKEIRYVDTVKAFHFGNNFLVEVDIVLPEDMTVRVAHDIGEELQQKLERHAEVERAFVHIDYEATHKPDVEHKVM